MLDAEGTWQYVNDFFAALFDKKREWFVGRNMFDTFPELGDEWRETIRTVAETRETFIDRSFRGVPNLPKRNARHVWNVLAFPIKLHDDRNGVVMSARVIERKGR